MELRDYTRWRRLSAVRLHADLLMSACDIIADTHTGRVELTATTLITTLSPDSARLLGVRLIEGATLADGARSIRAERSRHDDA